MLQAVEQVLINRRIKREEGILRNEKSWQDKAGSIVSDFALLPPSRLRCSLCVSVAIELLDIHRIIAFENGQKVVYLKCLIAPQEQQQRLPMQI
jgi:hypothetical protein